MGRPRLEIDPHKVELLAGCGCPPEEIAEALGCSRSLLYTKRFVTHLERGRLVGRQKLRTKQYEQAMKGSNQMLIWLGKQLLGQTDKVAAEHSGTVQHEHRPADEEAVLVAADRIKRRRDSLPALSE